MNPVTASRVLIRLLPFITPGKLFSVWKVSRLRSTNKDDDLRHAKRLIDQYGEYTRKTFAESRKSKHAIYVVIPSHNESRHLPALLVALARNDCVVPIVVNNSSTDETAAFAKEMGATVLDQPTGKKMAATQRGLAYARQKLGAKRVLFTDGDGLPLTGWAKTMDDQLKKMDQGSGAAVFGSAIYKFGNSRAADAAITTLGLTYEVLRSVRGELPIARGHNYGVSFDDKGRLDQALHSIDPNSFVGSGKRLPDDAEILRALNSAGAALRYTYDARTWIVTTNDRVRSVSDVSRLLRPGVSYDDITSESYQQEYGRTDTSD